MVKGVVETVKEAGIEAPLESSGITYLYIYGIKNAFVVGLRAAFGDESMPAEYRYNKDSNKSQIAIYRNFPNRLEKLPRIIVESSGGSAGLTTLGDEIEYEDDNVLAYSGNMTLDLKVTIETNRVRDLDDITDLTILFMRFLFKSKFQELNLVYNNITVAGETYSDESLGTIYRNVIDTKITSDFSANVNKELVKTIQNVELKIGSIEIDEEANT